HLGGPSLRRILVQAGKGAFAENGLAASRPQVEGRRRRIASPGDGPRFELGAESRLDRGPDGVRHGAPSRLLLALAWRGLPETETTLQHGASHGGYCSRGA